MTSTQLLALVITGLAVVLAADLVRLSWANRRKQQIDVEPGFRRVGTFGSLRNFESSSGVSSTAESSGGGHSMIVAGLLLILLAAGGVVFKVSWDEAHPDIRTPGNAVLITFDDGYADFLTTAWPLLQRYGFSALLFVVSERVGRVNDWERAHDGRWPLLDWDQLSQLSESGLEIGSHSASHRFLSGLSPAEIAAESLLSKRTLEDRLGKPVTAFAYPYGEQDPAIRHLVGASGYEFGLGCRPGLASQEDDLLDLPRIEVSEEDSIADFIGKLAGVDRTISAVLRAKGPARKWPPIGQAR